MREFFGVDRFPSWVSWILGLLCGVGVWEFVKSPYGASTFYGWALGILIFPGLIVAGWTIFFAGLAVLIWCWERFDWLRLRLKHHRRISMERSASKPD